MPTALSDLSALSLAEIATRAADQKLPPVASWAPEKSGHSQMRIAADGTWFHEGSPIRRESMVRLFSTILRREADGSHVLVTPAERLTIDVDDAPYIAVEMKSAGSGKDREIAVRLNTGEVVVVDADHRLIARGTIDAPAHYVHARAGLEARVARAVYYELAEIALAEGADPIGVWSKGQFFPLEPAI